MAHRTLHADLEASLLANDAFAYAHLVKFEKPIDTETGYPVKTAKDYAYISDGSHDVSFDDGSKDINGNANGSQVYIANRLKKVGSVTETIQARASNINLEIDAIALNTTFTSVSTFTSTTFTAGSSIVDEGFAEGDTILLTSSNSNNTAKIRIDSFSNENKTASYTPINRSSLSTGSANYTFSFASDEVQAILQDTGETGYAGYINREVFIYKAHINPDTGVIIGAPYLLFKGIIASAKLSEDVTKDSKISWSLTSHWGDFVRVNGRLTSDPEHRALNGEGVSDSLALIRPEYGSDLGFMHSEQALNLVANYNVMVTKTKLKMKRKWYGAKTYKQVEYQEEEEREVDLRFNLDAKRLPVVYGVQRIQSFPVFVDTKNDDSKQVYVAYAMCEGEIGGLYDIYIDDQSSICIDKNDLTTRSGDATNSEVICTGRMDRGDTLTAQNVSSGTAVSYNPMTGTFGSGWEGYNGTDGAYGIYLRNLTPIADTSVSGGASTQGAGIYHEKGTKLDSPLPMKLTMHTGKPFQKSDDTLSAIAAAGNFKIQTDYFTGTGDYWGPNHQLLDTAYVTAHYTIGEGDTTIPDLEFVVRGKVIDCYDYDDSFVQDSFYSGSDAAITAFNIGDIVTIKNTSNATLGTSTIADISTYKDTNNNDVHRVRFQDLDRTDSSNVVHTAFYMLNGSNQKYSFATHDNVYVDSSVPATLTAVTSFSDNSGGSSIDATFTSPSTALQEAVSISDFVTIVDNADLAGSVAAIIDTMGSTFEFTNSSGVLRDIGGATGASSLASTAKVIIKDCIQLSSSSSDTDDAYNGMIVEVTRNYNDNSTHVQKHTIVDYDGGTRVAKVDKPFDNIAVPQAGDTFRILNKGDKRVSLNPTIQLVDYLTSERYGRGLNVLEDLDPDSFKQAARDCDTRSDVTMLLANTSVALNAVYKLLDTNSKLRFQGKVKTITAVTVGGTTYDEVTFTDVIGKVAKKWTDYAVYEDAEYVWHNDKIYEKSGAGSLGTAPSGNSSSVNPLTKISGTGPSTIAINVSLSTFEGNPIVKKYNSNTTSFGTGYSLYDADNVKYWRYLGWDSPSQSQVTRHQTNAIVNTTSSVFENINAMLAHFNGMLRYVNGKYEIVVKTATDTFGTAQSIGDDDIIGAINVEDAGQKGTFNSVSVSIPDPQNRYNGRSVNFINSTYIKQDRNVPKKGNLKTPYITNYFNARINAKQYLEESRKNLKIAFKMEPKGLLLTAGSLIKVTNTRFNWSDKLFRLSNLTFTEDCLVNVTAEEHSEEAFLISTIDGGSVTGSDGGAPAIVTIAPHTNLSIPANSLKGGARLTWTNSAKFNSATHTTEIWRSSSNDVSTASIVGLSKSGLKSATGEFTDAVVTGGATFFYWVRYSVVNSATVIKELNSVYVGSVSATTTDIVNGVDGDQGVNTAAVYAYKRASSALASSNKPSTTRTWTFATGTFNNTDLGNGWTSTVPSGTDDVYVCVAVSAAEADTDSVAAADWSAPQLFASNGADAVNSAPVFAYKRSASAVNNKPSTTRTWTFSTAVFNNINLGNGFTSTVPSGTDDIYICTAVASSVNSTDNVAAADWSAAELFASNGDDGDDGDDGADGVDGITVVLSNESHSLLTAANGDVTYTGSGTTIRLYEGTTELIYDGVGTASSRWKATTTGVSVTAGSVADSGDFATVGNHSSMTANVASVTYNITGKRANGTAFSFARIQSLTKTITGTDGDPGAAGINTAVVYAYQRASSNPGNKPSTTRTWSFGSGSFNSSDLGNSWTSIIPTGSADLYFCAAVANGTGSTDTVAAGDWTAAQLFSSNGDNGAAGANGAPVSLYRKSTSNSSAPASFSGTFTYTFATGAVTGGTLNSWTATVPTLAAGEYAWVRQATASASATTDTIPTSEFSAAVVHSGVGEDGASVTGAAGNSNALVALYRVSSSGSSAPASFSGTLTYTFATGAVTGGTLNSWTRTIPTVAQGSYLWVRQATASSNTNTDTIAIGEWSAAVVTSASGVNGDPGAAGVNTAPVFAYKRASSTPGNKPGTTRTYTFSTGVFNNSSLGNSWTSTIPSGTTNLYICTAIASSTSSTDNVVAGDWSSAQLFAASGVDGDTGPSGFLFFLSGDSSTDNAHISASSPATGQIAIVENTSGAQAGYRYSGSAWVSKDLINTGIIVADAIKSEQLEISADSGNDRIQMDGTNNVIKIYSGGVLRIKIGNLA